MGASSPFFGPGLYSFFILKRRFLLSNASKSLYPSGFSGHIFNDQRLHFLRSTSKTEVTFIFFCRRCSSVCLTPIKWKLLGGTRFWCFCCCFLVSVWNDFQTSLLLQDVNDRIEKEPDEPELLVSLQKDSIPVVRGDWKVHLSSELQEGEWQNKTKRGGVEWIVCGKDNVLWYNTLQCNAMQCNVM